MPTQPLIQRWQNTGGSANGVVAPIFSAPLITSLVPDSSAGSSTPTVTRATAAYVLGYLTTIAAGPTQIQCASGEARFMGARRIGQDNWSAVDSNGVALTTANGASALCCNASGPFGYLAEGAATNSLLWSNDLTNAAWTKVTMTTAFTSTGPDGIANSATRLTATGINATVLQTIVAAASSRTYGVWMRRVTGTGNITLQQTGTTLEVKALLNSTTYTLVQVSGSVLNAIIGITIATSGDAIDVWCNQFEAGAVATSPIPTTTIAVARNTDVLTYPASGNISGTVGSAYAEFTTLQIGTITSAAYIIAAAGALDREILGITQVGSKTNMYDGTTDMHDIAFSGSSSIQKLASVWGGSTMKTFLGGTAGAGAAFDGDFNLATDFQIGNGVSAANSAKGTIRGLRIYGQALSASQLVAMTTP